MRMTVRTLLAAMVAGLVGSSSLIGCARSTQPGSARGFLPGGRVLLDAHNAYPDRGRFAERLDQALATGLPLAVEQDLAFCPAGESGARAPVVTHEKTCEGGEPTLDAYFFTRVAPLLDEALEQGPSPDWPLITLNLDFKTDEPEHHRAVWDLLGRYERWLTTAPHTGGGPPAPLRVGPLLVLTGVSDVQEQTFHASVTPGATLRVFGAIHGVAPAEGETGPPRATPATNYRRWWNHPWRVVEPEGQRDAGAWTPADRARLETVVRDAHDCGLWIRVYTLNGHDGPGDGWTASYNFGSPEAAAERWGAAIAAGVDFIATDQYAALAAHLPRARAVR